MSKNDKNSDESKTRERLALLGLAVDRSKPAGPCPDDHLFARLVEEVPGSAEQHEFVEHLSGCESCFQKWLILSEELNITETKQTESGSWLGRRHLLGAVGSACALAMGVMLYLAIDYRPLPQDAAEMKVDDIESNGSSISHIPSPASEAELEMSEKSQALREPGAVVSGAALDALKRAQDAEPTKPAARSSVPLTKQEMDRELSIQGNIAEYADQMADEPMSREKKNVAAFNHQAPKEKTEPAASGSSAILEEFEAYVELILDLCAENIKGTVPADLREQAAETGQILLEADMSGAIRYREFIEETMQLLEKETSINDKEWSSLCERARTTATGIDKIQSQ